VDPVLKTVKGVERRVLGKLSPSVLVIFTLLLIMCLSDPCCSVADHVSL
jgi:hypothetical protein